jgi:phosphoribosylaminoimidazole-succinocarboxamide synthase
MKKLAVVYRGKAKTLYTTADPHRFILEFRDDTSAFNGRRVEALAGKGALNNQINHFIMQRLQGAGIATQLERLLSADHALVKKLTMLPVECVVRNRAAGGLCRRLAIAEGQLLNPPLFELFLKNDDLDDPLINEFYGYTFGWITPEQYEQIKQLSFQINALLVPLFQQADLLLVDYKLEFGLLGDQIVLGDEISPDNCRLWDKKSGNKLDKDRFRQDLGDVIKSYLEVAQRLGIDLIDQDRETSASRA